MNSLKTSLSIKTSQKCRCCATPSSKFLELDSVTKGCGAERTYKDVLYEITSIKVTPNQEKTLTQKVCYKCSTQLSNCYKFIVQAREVCDQYLRAVAIEDDVKIFEYLPEPLVEVEIDAIAARKSPLAVGEASFAIAESPLAIREVSHITGDASLASEEIKTEPFTIECTHNAEELVSIADLKAKDIKKENQEENSRSSQTNKEQTNGLSKDPTIPIQLTIPIELQEEERDHHENFNSDSDDNYNDEDEDPISEDEFDKDLSKAPVAISCDICHKIYKDKVALRTHKHYTHMPEEKKRPCPLCNFKSSRLSNLKVHVGVVHGAEKVKEIFKPAEDNGVQFPCSICQQTFRRKDTLHKHIKRIHQNPQRKEPRIEPKKPKEKERFLCTYCGGSFRSKYGLSRHVVIHTGERPFPCEICQKTFKRPEDLHIHRIIHSDEKPHQCLQCGKAFKRSDKLKIHMRVHSELRPYKCNECEKTFKYPSVLSTHMLIHTGQNPFQCKTCGEAFSLRSSLNSHCLRNGHL